MLKKKKVRILVHDKPGRGRKKFKCSHCGAVKYKIKSRIKVKGSKFNFCGIGCKNQAQKIGGVLASKQSGNSKHYRKKALRLLPNECARCRYKRRVDILQVHHKDKNRKNDRITNLEILCPNCHNAHHVDDRKKNG